MAACPMAEKKSIPISRKKTVLSFFWGGGRGAAQWEAALGKDVSSVVHIGMR